VLKIEVSIAKFRVMRKLLSLLVPGVNIFALPRNKPDSPSERLGGYSGVLRSKSQLVVIMICCSVKV